MRFVKQVTETGKSLVYLDLQGEKLPGFKFDYTPLLKFHIETYTVLKSKSSSMAWDIVFRTTHEFFDTRPKSEQLGFATMLVVMHYEIIDKLECGIELKGTEVKSIRDGMCNLKDSFALIRNNEILLKNMHISPYEHGNIYNVNPTRDRKLLVHKKEVLKLLNYIKQGGYTLVPSKLYTKGRWFKIELCICKGKKLYDKRESLKEKEAKKQINAFKS